MRATICVIKDQPEQATAVEEWFRRWGDGLTFVSENKGCGCCVDMWDVEGPEEAIREIPKEADTWSDWAGFPPHPDLTPSESATNKSLED